MPASAISSREVWINHIRLNQYLRIKCVSASSWYFDVPFTDLRESCPTIVYANRRKMPRSPIDLPLLFWRLSVRLLQLLLLFFGYVQIISLSAGLLSSPLLIFRQMSLSVFHKRCFWNIWVDEYEFVVNKWSILCACRIYLQFKQHAVIELSYSKRKICCRSTVCDAHHRIKDFHYEWSEWNWYWSSSSHKCPFRKSLFI